MPGDWHKNTNYYFPHSDWTWVQQATFVGMTGIHRLDKFTISFFSKTAIPNIRLCPDPNIKYQVLYLVNDIRLKRSVNNCWITLESGRWSMHTGRVLEVIGQIKYFCRLIPCGHGWIFFQMPGWNDKLFWTKFSKISIFRVKSRNNIAIFPKST